MLNPAHVDLFRAVLRHGGMTRAAAALGIGQPHVSRAIAQLEAGLGFQLFVRGHGSALPTPEGEAFAHEVARTQAGLEHLWQAARQIRELGTGPLRLACQPSLAARLLPRALRRLSDERPGVRVTLYEPGPDVIWSWAAAGQCDIGLARPRSGHAGVAAELFLSVDAVCAMPRRHPLAHKRTITVQDLAGETLISGAPGTLQTRLEQTFAKAGVTPRFTFLTQYTVARCSLVAEGLGLAIVDPIPARALGGLPIVLRPFRPQLSIETMLVRTAGRPPSQGVTHFIRLLEAARDELMPAAAPSDRD